MFRRQDVDIPLFDEADQELHRQLKRNIVGLVDAEPEILRQRLAKI